MFRLLRRGRRAFSLVALVCALDFGLALVTSRVTLRAFPNSGDEYTYLISALLFTTGRLSVPSPEPRHAFDLLNVVNNGRFYGKYPPGWPAVLALGVKAGVPWIVNPILGVLSLWVIHRIARRRFSDRVANLAVLSLLASPYVVFESASFFSHPLALLCATLCLWAADRLDAGMAPWRSATAFGAAGGALFLTRPYTAVAVLLPLGFWLAWQGLRSGRTAIRVRELAVGAAVFAPFAMAVLWYNRALTGNAWLPPAAVYNPADLPGLNPGTLSVRWGLTHNVVRRLWGLDFWQPGSVVLLAIAFMAAVRARGSRLTPLFAVWIAVFVFHAAYLFDPGNGYGPRYLYDALAPLAIAGGWAMSRWSERAGRLAAGTIIVANVVVLAVCTVVYGRDVRARMQPFDLAAARGLDHAIVFIGPRGSGSMLALDLIRNGVDFDGPVIYARDLGAGNQAVLDRYPGRTAWRFAPNPVTGRGELTPYAARR